ncbi:MAG: hypothetical protein ABI947_00475 [Chloroflexota bacterium]
MSAIPSVPLAAPDGVMHHINIFLDKYVLPYPVRFLTNRVTILATLLLLIPLIMFADNTAFGFAANGYLNVMSVVVSSTVLLYSTIGETRSRIASRRREEIARAHEARNDARSQADHEAIQQIHDHLNEIHREVLQNMSVSLDSIQTMLIMRMEKMQDADRELAREAHEAMIRSADAHRQELADLARVVAALHIQLNGLDEPLDDQNG